jgi:hypothetical protein
VPFGQLTAPVISLAKTGPTTFAVTATADGHGLPVTVHVWTDRVPGGWNFSTTNAGSQSFSYNVSYSQSDQAHVTISDSAGRALPAQQNSGTVTADPPPPPPSVTPYDTGIQVVKTTGTICNADKTCFRVGATIANFGGRATCHMSNPTDSGFFTWQVNDNSSANSTNYVSHAAFSVVQVTCTGPNGTASGQINW